MDRSVRPTETVQRMTRRKLSMTMSMTFHSLDVLAQIVVLSQTVYFASPFAERPRKIVLIGPSYVLRGSRCTGIPKSAVAAGTSHVTRHCATAFVFTNILTRETSASENADSVAPYIVCQTRQTETSCLGCQPVTLQSVTRRTVVYKWSLKAISF